MAGQREVVQPKIKFFGGEGNILKGLRPTVTGILALILKRYESGGIAHLLR